MAEEDKKTDNSAEENLENTTAEGDEKDPENTENTDSAADDGNVKKDDSADEETEEEEKEEDIKPEDVDLDNPEEVSNALDKKGIDYNALTEEYLTKGELSEESFKTLEAAGIPREVALNYIKGYEARAEIEKNELAECVGGKEQMEAIINWAANNLSKEEIVALNSIRNKFELKAVLRGLKTDMEEKEGKSPDYQKGTGDTPTINGFRSQAEMFEAINNPKYNKDEAYRADVQKKIAASREAGIDLGIY